MYIVTAMILWKAIDIFSGGEFTNELGSIVGFLIMLVYAILYIVAFAIWPDWNWIDFHYANFFQNLFKW